MDFTWGLLNLKPDTFQRLHVIDFGAIQIQQAGLIDEDLQAVVVVGLVQHVRLVFEGHRIAEARASAADHGDAQPGREPVPGRLMISLTLPIAFSVI